jgi:hypothetical protein
VEEKLLKKLQTPIYPFLLAAYPILELLSYNISQVKYPAAIRPLLLACLAAGLLFLIFRLTYRNAHRAAFIVAVWLLLFFSYGQVYDAISGKWKIPFLTTWMLGTWLVLAILALVLAALRKLHFEGLALTLNLVSLGLVVYVLFAVINWSFIKTAHAQKVIGSVKTGSAIARRRDTASYLLHHARRLRTRRYAAELGPDRYHLIPEIPERQGFL